MKSKNQKVCLWLVLYLIDEEDMFEHQTEAMNGIQIARQANEAVQGASMLDKSNFGIAHVNDIKLEDKGLL